MAWAYIYGAGVYIYINWNVNMAIKNILADSTLFFLFKAYTSVLKGCLDNLKKRERKTAKSKKAKATQ